MRGALDSAAARRLLALADMIGKLDAGQ